MRKTFGFLSSLFVFFSVLGLCAAEADAQSSSTDIQPAGTFYLELDLHSHLARLRHGGHQTYAARLVFGLRRGLEAGINVESSDPVVPDQGVELQPHLKWRFYDDERRGTAAGVGALLYLPVGRRAGTDTFGMLYANFSEQLRGRYGPRLTCGAYVLPQRLKDLGSRAGVTLSYAQPLSGKVSFGVDWVGGDNRFGFVTPGLSFAVSRRGQLTVGYSIGNEGRGNNELAVAYGIQF